MKKKLLHLLPTWYERGLWLVGHHAWLCYHTTGHRHAFELYQQDKQTMTYSDNTLTASMYVIKANHKKYDQSVRR